MVKNNIVIKINDKIADYDDNTAIGITYNAFNPSEIDKIFLTTTNEFSLPITLNNKKIFDFAENPNSNPNSVYDKMSCYIYLDNISILRGDCYIRNINDRYNVHFIEGKNVFDKLKALRFAEYQGDEYPNSLMNLFANYWNDNILPDINSKYGEATTAKQMLDNVISYCNEIDNDGYPVNDVVIPICDNAFGHKAVVYNSNKNTPKVYDNNIYSKSSSSDPTGMIIAAKLPTGNLTDEQGSGRNVELFIGDSHQKNYRGNTITVSPIWANISVLTRILEGYTGYEFYNLEAAVEEVLGHSLFCRCNGVEFDLKLEAKYSYDKENQYVKGVTQSMNWNGEVFMQKAIPGWYGAEFENEELKDVDIDKLTSSTALDFLKTLMNEFNLVVTVDNVNKKLSFQRLSSIKTYQAYELPLVDEKDKKFYIDGIKQKQVIDYKTIEDNSFAKKLVLTSSNNNIEEGSTEDAFLTIDRTIFGTTNYYGSQNWYNRDFPVIGNKELSGILFAIPKHSIQATMNDEGRYVSDDFKRFCIYISYRLNDNSGINESYSGYFVPLKTYTSDDLECIVNDNYINTLYQPTVGKHNAYDYYQSVIYKPTVEEITVKKDLIFLHNWKNLRKVKITGLTGVWYVQGISEFNPRTDDKMTLNVVKLPADTELK